MKIGLVLDGPDHFIKPIEADLGRDHRVERFTPHFVRLPLIGKRVNDVLLLIQLRQFLERQDVALFEWAGPLAALASRESPKTKKVVRAHRTELFTQALTFDWTGVDKVVCVSEVMSHYLLERASTTKGRIVVVPNGVNLSRFAATARDFQWRIGMLGNLTPRKRVYDVICSLAALPKDVPWQLFVGGAPVECHFDYWEGLQHLVEQLDVRQQVQFHGGIAEPALWLKKVDVFISASYSEGHQVALLEAMASACYCLGHCWSGVENVLPHENIFLTDEDLRRKLLAYASIDEDLKRHKQTHMRLIAEERFDERRMLRDITSLLEQVANE